MNNSILDSLKRLGAIDPESSLKAMPLIVAGDDLYDKDMYVDAIVLYSKAIAECKSNPYLYYKRGDSYRLIGELDYALQDLYVAKSFHNEHYINQAIGECFLIKGFFLEAISAFQESLNGMERLEDINKLTGEQIFNFNKSQAKICNNMAHCYFKLNNIQEAIKLNTLGIDYNPNYSNNYAMRGLIYLSLGNSQDAKKDLTIAANLGNSKANEVLEELA